MKDMLDKILQIESKYTELGQILSDPEVIQDYNKFKALSKQRKAMEETVETYQAWKEADAAVKDAEELLKSESDETMREFLRSEISDNEAKMEELKEKMKVLLLPRDPMDDKDIMLEIRGSAGGDEANIFAGDLFRMYTKYAEKQGWKLEITNEVPGESGGYSQIEFMLSGESVYSKLKYESGAHRVQRVPETESQGRVHTSTATVLVMPEAEEIDIEIKDSDLRIDITRSSGAGGQCVNTTDSAVRITHLPTNIVVYCQVERSQIKNKEKAMQILKTRLYDLKQREQDEKMGNERRSKIGTGDRSEKIRTYNYPQNRLTDHRINYTVMHLDRMVEGDIEELINALIAEDERMRLGETNA